MWLVSVPIPRARSTFNVQPATPPYNAIVWLPDLRVTYFGMNFVSSEWHHWHEVTRCQNRHYWFLGLLFPVDLRFISLIKSRKDHLLAILLIFLWRFEILEGIYAGECFARYQMRVARAFRLLVSSKWLGWMAICFPSLDNLELTVSMFTRKEASVILSNKHVRSHE